MWGRSRGLLSLAPLPVLWVGVLAARPAGPPLSLPPGWLLPAEAPQGLEEVVAEMELGRFWHAGRLLREIVPGDDFSPQRVLLAARAEAGWGNWGQVRSRLRGRTWLSR